MAQDCGGRGQPACPSVDAGCGYKLSRNEDGSVKIYPTENNSTCSFEFGVGNATFRIDPKNPPESIERLITADSEGSYAPFVSFGLPRVTKSFSGVEMIEESNTDADGNTETFEVPKLVDFSVDAVAGSYKFSGIRQLKHYYNHRIMWGTPAQKCTFIIPYEEDFIAIQYCTISSDSRGYYSYAYLNVDGEVVVSLYGRNPSVLDMGLGEDSNNFVVEFTISEVSSVNTTLLLKNSDGVVVKVFVNLFATGVVNLGVVGRNIIKVCCGEMLEHDGSSYVFDSDGGYIPTDAGGSFDIVSDRGIPLYVNTSSGRENIKMQLGEYKVTIDDELMKGELVIGSGITSIALQSSVSGYVQDGQHPDLRATASQISNTAWGQANVDAITNTENRAGGISSSRGILALSSNGTLYKIIDDELVEQITADEPTREIFDYIFENEGKNVNGRHVSLCPRSFNKLPEAELESDWGETLLVRCE